MKSILIALSLTFAVTACSESECEKYAKMEWDCGNFPASEKDITMQLAEGMCTMAKEDDSPEAKQVREMFAGELECSKTAKNCAEYEACKRKRTGGE